MRRVAVLFVLAVTAGTSFSFAATPANIVAVPGSATAGFATQAVVIQPGDPLTLRNFDITFHSIRAEAFGSDDQPWCGPLNPGPETIQNPRRFSLNHCPLFWSDLALPLGGTRAVFGVDALVGGRAYPFRCGVHPAMRGALITP